MTRTGTYLTVIALLLASPHARADERDLVVITHPSRPIELTTSDLRHLFLRRQRYWPDGSPVIAINQTAATPARELFEDAVFGAETSALPGYWNRRYFEGVFPPITFGSDAAVQRYVATKPNAIGYVDARSVDGSVHVALHLGRSRKSTP